MWDPHQGRTPVVFVAALLTFLLLAAACSGEKDGKNSANRTEKNFEEGTLATSKTGREKTETTSPPEATLGRGPASPGIVLRLEGDPKTTFSGVCTVGGKENVLSGRVPKRYAFRAKRLSCRIQKQNPAKGNLKAILTANNSTRSVQQTSTRGGVIHISYTGG